MTTARPLSGRTQLLLVLTVAVVALSLLPAVHAFGAGNIPAFSYLEGKAFRHGDIEDILAELAKKAGHGFMGIGGGSKFGGLDIKRVYTGNWSRDYSQASVLGSLKHSGTLCSVADVRCRPQDGRGGAQEDAGAEHSQYRNGAWIPCTRLRNGLL